MVEINKETMEVFKNHLESIFYLSPKEIEESFPTGHAFGNYYTFSFKTSKLTSFQFKKIMDEGFTIMEWRVEPISTKNVRIFIHIEK